MTGAEFTIGKRVAVEVTSVIAPLVICVGTSAVVHHRSNGQGVFLTYRDTPQSHVAIKVMLARVRQVLPDAAVIDIRD